MGWLQQIVFLYALLIHPVVYGTILFRKHCINGTDPETIPGVGKDSAGFIKMNDVVSSYDPGLNCSVTITAEKDYHLLVAFTLVSLRNSSLDSLTVFYNNETQNSVLSGQQKCANSSCSGLLFDSGKSSRSLTFHFITANITVQEEFHGFKALFTSYDVNKKGVCQGANRFLCLNGHCISKEFVCDGNNNCGDLSDEKRCRVSEKDTIWGVVAIVLAVIACSVFVPAFCIVAMKGTVSIIKSVTVPNQATPLYSAINDETTRLTSSVDRSTSCYWGSSSCSLDRRHSYSTGTAIQSTDKPSTSNNSGFVGSYQGETGVHIPS